MDPFWVAVVSAVVGAVVGAVIAGLATIGGVILAGRMARTAAAEADARLEARERRTRVRDARLEAIDQTKRSFHAMLADALHLAAGGGALEQRYGPDAYPLADIRLAGDAEAVDSFIAFATELATREPRIAHRSDAAEAARVSGLLIAALERQADRARNDQPLLEQPATASGSAVVAEAWQQLGVSPPA